MSDDHDWELLLSAPMPRAEYSSPEDVAGRPVIEGRWRCGLTGSTLWAEGEDPLPPNPGKRPGLVCFLIREQAVDRVLSE